ncbi:UDP-glucose--hexose-1-phosphate uridylyltransferase [Paenibacillus sp. GCM10027626]|uniref:UDP-glucose--hexose-1-phosphate uridylyltransferase n=1 Tax=Paenibacillus sp. GCM10027626 TaxID=3273411 RepID=UPI00363DB358
MEEQQMPNSGEVLVLIERLLQFAEQRGMIEPLDLSAARNSLLDLFQFAEPGEAEVPEERLDSAVTLLEPLLDYGAAIGLIPDNTTTFRDLLDARIMGLLMPRPSETAARFSQLAKTEGIAEATSSFYALNIDSNYIRMDRIRRNQYWRQPTAYGELEITINLSKPEKDPKEIALLKTMAPSHYPKCLLCSDNVGYAGRANHPARQNLRIIPLELQGERWYFQYSPYVYYNEHSIVLHGQHVPMQISEKTFARLLDFVEQVPHYFIGSNADLPIVGGSILNHDHFQAGRHTFPMEVAAIDAVYSDPQLSGVRYSIVAWPMSVVRIQGCERAAVQAAAAKVLDGWRAYTDPAAHIFAYSDQDGEQIPHNTITPIARRLANGEYELDLVLRNNRKSDEHPDGIFHPHAHLHHIKKENIGLIEVMGLAVLPGRLKEELEAIASLLGGSERPDGEELRRGPLSHHTDWIERLIGQYGTSLKPETAHAILQEQVGLIFLDVLHDAGVYKRTETGQEAFGRFLASIGLKKQ